MTQPDSTNPPPPDPQQPYQQTAPGGWQQYPPAGYQPPPYGYPPQPIYVQAPPTSGLATASLVLGLLGIVASWWTLWIPTFLAIIFGHVALGDTKHGAKGGRGLAVAGLILAYLMLIPLALAIVGLIASRNA